jgi:hypothetical protein
MYVPFNILEFPNVGWDTTRIDNKQEVEEALLVGYRQLADFLTAAAFPTSKSTMSKSARRRSTLARSAVGSLGQTCRGGPRSSPAHFAE